MNVLITGATGYMGRRFGARYREEYEVYGIVSSIWSFSPKYQALRENKSVSYFDFYTEKWANHLGEKVTGKKSMERIDV